MMTSLEGQQLAAAQAGDAAAFAALAERHRPRVQRLARRLLPEAEEDCVQLTFVRAWERLAQLREGEHLGAWLAAICRSVAANLREAECTRRDREHAAFRPTPEQGMDRIITRLWIREAVQGLPEPYRHAVDRFYFHGWSHRDIAQELRVPVTTVKKRLHDARLRLKEALQAMPAQKTLHGLRFSHRWVSHLGAIKGCFDYLGRDLSSGWLFGGTGHAFLLSIHREVCMSGPTVWDWNHLFRLARNLGIRITGICTLRKEDGAEFRQRQAQAWDLVRDAINREIPCYGWELSIPEFACIHGYDETGYYFSGRAAGDNAGPRPWAEVGNETGLLSMYVVESSDAVSSAQAVKEALQFALDASMTGETWWRDYFIGLSGYDAWARAVEGGTAGRFGQGYNAICWAECRGEAVSFLRQAKQRLPGRADAAFDEAMQRYAAVHSRLLAVSALAPFHVPEGEGERYQSAEAADLLRQAKAAEEQALRAVAEIVKAL